MAIEKEKWVSVMVVPESGTGMKKWRISASRFKLYKTLLVIVCGLAVTGLVSIIAISLMSARYYQYTLMNRQLIQASAQLQMISERLEGFERKEILLRELLGSDIELPEPVLPEPERLSVFREERTQTSADEIELAIERKQAESRRIPTMWPVNAWRITKGFINTGDPRTDHHGIDLLALARSDVVASGDGMVVFSSDDPELGLLIVIDHGNGWVTRYGHNAENLVQYGATVRKGQLIATYGGTEGASTGPHLHFGVTYNGVPRDPLEILEKRTGITFMREID